MLTPAVFLCVCSIFFHLMSISIKQYLPKQQERWHGDSKMDELDDLWEERLPTRLKVGMAQRKKKKKIKLSAFRLVPCKPDLLHMLPLGCLFFFFFPEKMWRFNLPHQGSTSFVANRNRHCSWCYPQVTAEQMEWLETLPWKKKKEKKEKKKRKPTDEKERRK